MGSLFLNEQQQHRNQQDDDKNVLPLDNSITNDTTLDEENQQQQATTTRNNNNEMGNTSSTAPFCMDGNESTKKGILLVPLTGDDDDDEGQGAAVAVAATRTTTAALSEDHMTQCELQYGESTSPRDGGAPPSASLFKHEHQPQQQQSETATSSPNCKLSKRRGRWSRHSEHVVSSGQPAAPAAAAAATTAASRHSWHAGERIRRRRKGHQHESSNNNNDNGSSSIAHQHHHHNHPHFGLHRLTAFMAHLSSSSSKGTTRVFRKTGRAFSRFLTSFEEFFFPKSPLAHEFAARQGQHCIPSRVRGGVLMEGCETPVEHYARIQHVVQGLRDLQGAAGLAFCNLEYRLVHCPAHETVQEQEQQLLLQEQQQQQLQQQQQQQVDNDINYNNTLDEIQEYYQIPIANNHDNSKLTHVSSLPDLQGTGTNKMTTVKSAQSLISMQTMTSGGWTSATAGLDASHPPLTPLEDSEHCHLCSHRLVHIPTNTIIDVNNRKKYIADGDMYEAIARCCQEYAQDVMCVEGNLEWVTIEQQQQQQDDSDTNTHHHKPVRAPIRALVNSNHPLIQTSSSSSSCDAQQQQQHCRFESRRPTILIATGKGKVRAGIFSRQHLMCTSLESATALPIVKECRSRHLNMVIPDPNVHGDAYGYDTFSKTMAKLFASWETTTASTTNQQQDDNNNDEEQDGDDTEQETPPFQGRDLYILSHSASGAQIARYLLEKADAYIPHIKAIAFTDSTHNIQWCKQTSATTAAAAGSTKGAKKSDSSSCNKNNNGGTGSSNSDTHHGDELSELLQSSKSIYFRCANERRDGSRWYLHAAGDAVKTDDFWKHRFGDIQTYWAGTNEHSLTNWYAHAHIWRHFDSYLHPIAKATITQETQQHEYQEPSSLLFFGNASDEDNDDIDRAYSNDFALDLDEEDDICFDKIACTAPMTV